MEVVKHSDVVLIISNSEKEWVEHSCRKYLPFTFEAIQDIRMKGTQKLQILSAKHAFHKLFPSQPATWKKLAFKWFGNKFGFSESTKCKNVVVIGDQDFEINAGEELARTFQNCILKTIKYPSNKESVITPINLATRNKFLLSSFKNLVKSKKNCKWRINSNNKLLSLVEFPLMSDKESTAEQSTRKILEPSKLENQLTSSRESRLQTCHVNTQGSGNLEIASNQCSTLKSE